MKIALACDHGGYDLKLEVIKYLTKKGVAFADFGCDNNHISVDYPLYGRAACEAVLSEDCDFAVLCCGTGIGMSIMANKIRGIRAACCSEPYSAMLSRRHNDSNVLCMGARVVGPELAKMILDAWLNAEFEGGRHGTRVEMINEK